MMKPEEFDLRAAVVVGSAIDLTEKAAAMLNVNRRTVIRWRAGKARIPDGVVEELRRRSGSKHDLLVRHGRDRWLFAFGPLGPGGNERTYVVHRWPPRFVTRLVGWFVWPPDADTEDERLEAGRAAGDPVNQYQAFGEFEWIDPAPDGEDMEILVGEASGAIRGFRYDRDLITRPLLHHESLLAMRGDLPQPD